MSARKFDAVIVGARCAGASLATHLARASLSVALLDAARLPSEQPISTHLIQPPGMDELDALGVGDAVRCLSPSLRAARLDFDGREMLLGYGAGRAAHCLRRQPARFGSALNTNVHFHTVCGAQHNVGRRKNPLR